METQLAAILVAIIVGAIGGLLYVIMPPNEVRTLSNWLDKFVLAAKRMFLGAIAGALLSPGLYAIVKQSGWQLDWALIAVLVGLMSAGYFGLDIVRAALKKPLELPAQPRG